MLRSSRIPGLNDALQIGECMSNDKKISPVWLRVSTSPWDISSKKICGYGRPIKNITISDQMPAEFKRTEHLQRPPDLAAVKSGPASRRPGLEAAHVLPGGLTLLSSEQPPHARTFKKYNYQNQVIMEPQYTGRPNDRVRTSFDDPPAATFRPAPLPSKSSVHPSSSTLTSPIAKTRLPQPHCPSARGERTITINSSGAMNHSIGTARVRVGASNVRASSRLSSSARSSLAQYQPSTSSI